MFQVSTTHFNLLSTFLYAFPRDNDKIVRYVLQSNIGLEMASKFTTRKPSSSMLGPSEDLVKPEWLPAMKANCMGYKAREGKEKIIHIPAERSQEALEMFTKEDWQGLETFDTRCK
jgi:hypothetical protein